MGKAELSIQHNKNRKSLVFLLEGGDVGQPLVHCVLSWLRGSFNLWSAGLCVFGVKRCWPREDPERDFGAELRFSEAGPWAHQLICGFRVQTAHTAWRLEHTPRTVMIAVEMAATLCGATARWVTVATSSVEGGILWCLGPSQRVTLGREMCPSRAAQPHSITPVCLINS